MYFPNNSILSELKSNLNNLLFNYGSKQNVLNKKLSYFLGIEEGNAILLNGASQVYPLLQIILTDKKVLIPCPTFGEYERIFPKAETYEDLFGYDIQQIEKGIKVNDVIVFVNPNNPTGSVLQSSSIFNFAKNNPSKIFIVDESFIEFSDQKSIRFLLEEESLENIIIIKSLSKSLGVPGIRIGYVFSYNKTIIKKIEGYIPIWNINSLAEFFMEILLKHRTSLNVSYIQTIKDREEFIEQINNLNYDAKAYSSGGNFFVVKLKNSQNVNLPEIMISKYSIFIKDVSNKFNDGNYYIRLAVRTPSENLKLVSILDIELKKLNVANIITN